MGEVLLARPRRARRILPAATGKPARQRRAGGAGSSARTARGATQATVSTTLPKRSRAGQVQTAERGYRLTSPK